MTRNDEGPFPAACRSTGEGAYPRAPAGRAVNWDRPQRLFRDTAKAPSQPRQFALVSALRVEC